MSQSLISVYISIHAPASGATVSISPAIIKYAISIHAPASGATFDPVKRFLTARNFNPRSREWSDRQCVTNAEIYTISIHAPASGATGLNFLPSKTREFQSTLPRVERRLSPIGIYAIKNFNPRSREWSDIPSV